MTEFSSVVTGQWVEPFEAAPVIREVPGYRLAVDDDLSHGASAQILTRPGLTIARVTAATADLPGVREASNERELGEALASAGIEPNGADHLFFLPAERRAAVQHESDAQHVRQLTLEDAATFGRFESGASAQDLDDAYVELDHWVVFGAFEGDRLVAAGSAYPFDDDAQLADVGVLTLPTHRGRGHGLQVVLAMARHVLALGYEPQYRCQLDNAGSIALAQRAGFASLGTWDVAIAAADDED